MSTTKTIKLCLAAFIIMFATTIKETQAINLKHLPRQTFVYLVVTFAAFKLHKMFFKEIDLNETELGIAANTLYATIKNRPAHAFELRTIAQEVAIGVPVAYALSFLTQLAHEFGHALSMYAVSGEFPPIYSGYEAPEDVALQKARGIMPLIETPKLTIKNLRFGDSGAFTFLRSMDKLNYYQLITVAFAGPLAAIIFSGVISKSFKNALILRSLDAAAFALGILQLIPVYGSDGCLIVVFSVKQLFEKLGYYKNTKQCAKEDDPNGWPNSYKEICPSASTY